MRGKGLARWQIRQYCRVGSLSRNGAWPFQFYSESEPLFPYAWQTAFVFRKKDRETFKAFKNDQKGEGAI